MADEYHKLGFTVSTDPARLDLKLIHAFLTRSYWAEGIKYEKVKTAVDNSFCFGLFEGSAQIGFARVVTDYARIAYLADVFVLEPYRGKGLAQWLMSVIMAHPELHDIDKWFLVTADAHTLYEKYGFTSPGKPEMYMERVRAKIE